MKAVILAGGYGTRLSEETQLKPKPLVEVGGKPILWHIMKTYSRHGIDEFIICCGYKGELIKKYFSEYYLRHSDVTFDLRNNTTQLHNAHAEPWKVTLVDTGTTTMTGGRIRRIKEYLNQEEPFCLTYGDGVGDIDISETINFHNKHDKLATMVATPLPGRFGSINLNGSSIRSFKEKPKDSGGLVNAGFFVLEPAVIDLIEDDATVWEEAPLEHLARSGNLEAFRHNGFWKPMDTLNDKKQLETLWSEGAPWKIWDD